MRIIKRSGEEVEFDISRIQRAIAGANRDVGEGTAKHLDDVDIKYAADKVRARCEALGHTPGVEEIQNMVEDEIMQLGAFEVARAYITYRYVHEQLRRKNTTDDKILAIIDDVSEEAHQENSNKNPTIISVQRDYIAGTVSRDITRRLLLPPDIMKAHDEGIIHFHDSDYYLQHMMNCCLINLDDMLQNGTVISGTKIDKPHSFATACNIATQLISQVASNQFGGQTISLTPLAKFVDVSRKKIRAAVERELADANANLTDEQVSKMVEDRLDAEIAAGVQTIQYQIITLMTTNGQAPFVSVVMYLNEAENEREKADLARVIEEVIRQRYQGVKNKAGAWITPAFPKLLYFLEDDNVHENDRYFYLTKLAAKCSAKRLVPDYISEKKNLEIKYPTSKLLTIAERRDQWGDEAIWGPNPFKNCTDDEIRALQHWADAAYGTSRMPPTDIRAIMGKYGIKKYDLIPLAIPCMGCVDGNEIIAYRLNGRVYVEAFERAWMRLSEAMGGSEMQPNGMDRYIDLNDVQIWDTKEGFVDCYRIIRNHSSNWLRLTLSNGRSLTCTLDHPFETENRGVVHACDLTSEDIIRIDTGMPRFGNDDVSELTAWLYGFSLCDTTYDDQFTASIAETGEDDIALRFRTAVQRLYGLETTIIHQSRGYAGTYQDIGIRSDGTKMRVRIQDRMRGIFEGKQKLNRHIPNEVFSWNESARIAFLAGMIDADGYVNDHMRMSRVQIGSTNKELAIQQMLLAEQLGMRASIYANHYTSKDPTKLRWRVEFVPTRELIAAIACEKKKRLFTTNERQKQSVMTTNVCHVVKVEAFEREDYSYDVTTASEHFTVSGIYSHNCRSFLTPDFIHYRTYSRFNQGVVTINLPDAALAAKGDMDAFWKILDERLELCHRALRLRHDRLVGTLSDASPIHWQDGALARLPEHTKIDPLLYDNYSTLSLGYAGIYEACQALLGVSNTEKTKGEPFALELIKHLYDACERWRAEENISYSVYGTPLESTTYKFAKALQRHYGIIKNVNDYSYITNSYHVNVRENIDAFDKIAFESQFQPYSSGGAISYIECPDMKDNLQAVISVIQFIYDTIIYAELNTKSDYCSNCGYDGEMEIVERDGKLDWRCPRCGCTDHDKLHVARRTCGRD